ncbi:hypothetical protein BpHYR1_054574 [Brachionus plicatilis]|uniref:Uncharacterized protein n=1 Tax=Brachionus plicatilis TaxID=10195 RepID=A0A3M7R6T7_BRAPC|nr:hypothetical protein BpHYR1_054574 [Brachionus plicatilis]
MLNNAKNMLSIRKDSAKTPQFCRKMHHDLFFTLNAAVMNIICNALGGKALRIVEKLINEPSFAIFHIAPSLFIRQDTHLLYFALKWTWLQWNLLNLGFRTFLSYTLCLPRDDFILELLKSHKHQSSEIYISVE